MQVLRETRRLAGDDGKWVVKVLGEEGVGLVKKEKKKPNKAARKAAKKLVEEAKEKIREEKRARGEEIESGDEEEAGEPVVGEEEEEEGEKPYVGPIGASFLAPPPPPDLTLFLADILITTPLRLVFALKSSLISLSTTQHLILDEADKLFELNFLEQTDEILAACARPAAKEGETTTEVRKGMFSATMPSSVEELAKGVMAGAGGGMVRAIVGHKCVLPFPAELLCSLLTLFFCFTGKPPPLPSPKPSPSSTLKTTSSSPSVPSSPRANSPLPSSSSFNPSNARKSSSTSLPSTASTPTRFMLRGARRRGIRS
jgi:hypothetical protein